MRDLKMPLVEDGAAGGDPAVDVAAGRVSWTGHDGVPMTVPLADVVGAEVVGSSDGANGGAVVEVYHYPYPPLGGLRGALLGCCGLPAPPDAAAERVRRVHSVGFAGAGAGERATRFAAAVRAGVVSQHDGSDAIAAPAQPGRRPLLLVLVNPTSGPGRCLERFDAACRPLLADAGFDLRVYVTQGRADATRHLLGLPGPELAGLDGVLCCGGDGTLHEALQGLLDRPDAPSLLAAGRLPRLGAIPTGSGNGLAYGFCAAAGLPFSLSNAALLVAQRRTATLDVASTFTAAAAAARGGDAHAAARRSDVDAVPPASAELPLVKAGAGGGGSYQATAEATSSPLAWGARHFSFLSLEWAIIADLDIESEALRCLGAARFDVYGLIRAVALRKYRGRLSWLPATPDALARRRRAGGATPLPGGKAAPPPPPPSDAVIIPLVAPPSPVGNAKLLDGGFAPAQQPQRSGGATGGGSPFRVTSLRPFTEPLAGADGWQAADGVFTFLWITSTSHQSMGVALAPEAAADDGVFTLTFVRDISPAQMVGLLLDMDEKGTFRRHPFVEVHTASAYRLEPAEDDPLRDRGHIVVDGEAVPYAPTQAEIHPRLLPVYGVN